MLRYLVFCTCLIIVSAQLKKQGDCPPPTDIGICALTCYSDQHCRGITKCCKTACGGAVCTRPVTTRTNKNMKEKPGSCPENPSGPWVCSSRCAFDGDCRGKSKCCINRCGAMACTKPEH